MVKKVIPIKFNVNKQNLQQKTTKNAEAANLGAGAHDEQAFEWGWFCAWFNSGINTVVVWCTHRCGY